MAGKAEEHASDLAEQSVNTSIVHPTQANSDRRHRDGRFASDRRLNENDQREGMEKTDPERPRAEDRMKP
jgi:hypothetical protein